MGCVAWDLLCRREGLGKRTKKCQARLFTRIGSCQELGFHSRYSFVARPTTLPPNVTGSNYLQGRTHVMVVIIPCIRLCIAHCISQRPELRIDRSARCIIFCVPGVWMRRRPSAKVPSSRFYAARNVLSFPVAGFPTSW